MKSSSRTPSPTETRPALRDRSMSMSLEDYLEAIYMLILAGKRARVRDLAAALGVKTPSVVNGIRQLAELGLVTHAPYKSAELTPAGIERALQVLHRHKMLTTFLEFLGVSPDVAEADACRMEHFLPQETCDAISRHLEEHHISLEPPHESHSQKR